jgi:hypothetical protein
MSPQELLAVYTQRNLRLLYWQRNGCDPKEWKGPHHKGWNDPDRLYPLEQYDPQTMNLGTFTGHELASGKYLADFDPDWADGLVLVKKLLPETHFCFRRKGKLLSHAFYTTPDRLGSEKYCDIPESGGDGDGITFAELRGGNWSHQTMIAPSLHSPVICVELAESGDIAHVARHILQRAVLDYAIGCLLLKHLPGGLHHDGRLALAGFLLTRELTGERVQRLMEAICDAQMRALIPDMSAKDVTDCALVVQKTRQRLSENRKVKGGPKFAEFCGARGADIVARMRKWLEVADPAVILNPNDPLPSARAFVHARYTEDDVLTLRRQTGVFYHYRSDVAAYRECDDATVRAALYTFLESAKTRGEEDDDGSLWLPFRPTKFKVSNVMDALSAVTNLDAAMAAPCWLANDPGLNPLDMLACPNGLLHIPTRTLVPATPHFFTLNGLDFRFDPHAPTPTQWLSFLEQLWPGDAESVAALQEFFGYVLTPDTRFQKIFLIVGPSAAAKASWGASCGDWSANGTCAARRWRVLARRLENKG